MLHIVLNQSDGLPLYAQLAAQIKRLITAGRLAADSELPPVRTLAQQLVINPGTVVHAYRDLERAGLVYTRQGAGTYVKAQDGLHTPAERREILHRSAEAFVLEARHLGFEQSEILEVVAACNQRLAQQEGRNP